MKFQKPISRKPHIKSYQNYILTIVAVTAVFLAAGAVWPMMFCINDDVTMRNLLSGSYTGEPEGRAIYMKYPLSLVLSILYRLARSVPWFSFFVTGCFWLGCCMVLSHLVHTCKIRGVWKTGVIACMCLLCGVLFLPNFLCPHYTVAAAALAGCGIFLVVTGADGPAILLFVLCYCLRSQVFFLSLPFLGVIVLWRFWERKWKKQMIFLALLAGCVIFCAVWNGWMYRSEEWRQYFRYNEARTEFYDYHELLPFEEYKEQYESAGIDDTHYLLMKEYLISLDHSIDVGMMRKATDIHREYQRSGEGWKERLKDSVLDYYYHIRYTDKPFNIILIAAYFIAAILLIRQKRFAQLFLVFCMGAGRSLIWIYLIWRGRFPERLVMSLYILELMTLAGMLCAMLGYGGKENAKAGEAIFSNGGKRLAVPAFLLIGAVLLGMGISQIQIAGEKAAGQSVKQEEWNALTDYCENKNDSTYLLDVMSMVSYGAGVWEAPGKPQNYFLLGGWVSGSPYIVRKFAAQGAADGGELLLADGEKGQAGSVFFIASAEKNMQWMESYLSERFYPVHMELADKILYQGRELFCVYRFKKI